MRTEAVLPVTAVSLLYVNVRGDGDEWFDAEGPWYDCVLMSLSIATTDGEEGSTGRFNSAQTTVATVSFPPVNWEVFHSIESQQQRAPFLSFPLSMLSQDRWR